MNEANRRTQVDSDENKVRGNNIENNNNSNNNSLQQSYGILRAKSNDKTFLSGHTGGGSTGGSNNQQQQNTQTIQNKKPHLKLNTNLSNQANIIGPQTTQNSQSKSMI